jgi:CRISPR-associated protein Cas5
MIDIEILFKPLEKNVNAVLTIEPLAPLSMVSTMPGSFYKTLSEPSKFHIFGAFENALGWHFDEKTRREIRKKINAFFKKNKTSAPTWEDSDVGYLPLLEHILEIKPNPLILKTPKIFYKDLWKQMRKRGDWGHARGTINIDHEVITKKIAFISDNNIEKLEGNEKTKAFDEFFKRHQGNFPMYYTATGNREFVVLLTGSYYYNIKMSEKFFEILRCTLIENNITYLGTNEGWVNLKIHRL